MRRRFLLLLGGAMVLLAPFGEGGRTPPALLLLHTVALLYLAIAFSRASLSAWRGGPGSADPFLQAGLPMGAALLATGASSIGAVYPFAAGMGTWELVVPCVLFACALLSEPTGQDLLRLRLAVVASTLVQSILALARYPRGGAMAAGASFLNPSHLAAFLNVGFFLCATAAARAARPRERLLWGLGASVHLLSLGRLESRGAFLALVAGLLFLAGRDFRTWTPRLRAGALLLIGLVAAGAGLVVRERFARADDPYSYHRVEIWKASWEMIEDHPVLGHGPGSFPHVSSAYNFPAEAGPVRYGRTFHGAHNACLTLAAELGVPAALCFAAAAFACLRALLKRRREIASGLEGCVSGAGLSILALLVQGAVEDLQERPALMFVSALLAGTALGVLRGPFLRPAPILRPSRPARLIAATGMIYLFVLAVLLPYLADHEARAARRLGREGLPRMRRAAALVPFQPEYHHDLAMAILNSGPLSAGALAEAEGELLLAERLKPVDYRFPLLLARVEARFVPGLFDDRAARVRALERYHRAIRLAPLDPRPRLELAAHLVDLDRRPEALQVVREGLRLEPAFMRARILEASILLDLGRNEEARSSMDEVRRTLEALADYAPDSGYAREISADARSERERLEAILGGSATAGMPRYRSVHPPFGR
ncbi:MAG: O-antigen ligase family protein [Acidobacteria bacterium]|nr:O-antigen ligase family protein [Acidobacteriota bacterium]